MKDYEFDFTHLNNMMGLLLRVLKIRITFFDIHGHEIPELSTGLMSEYCQFRRLNSSFLRMCVECDKIHLEKAKVSKDVLIYRCHDGLLEGIVPLYNRFNLYQGAIVFGQLREVDNESSKRKAVDLYEKLPVYTIEECRDIGQLLKYMSEYIIDHEYIRYRNKPWVALLDRYIDDHLNEKITLKKLASLIERSPSFITHNFPIEFGESVKQYINNKRMNRAKELLNQGLSVYEVASELGYYDEFYFSKMFKQHWGKPPKDYKPS